MADETSPDGGPPGITEKIWAVLGLAAALVLAAMSVDLLLTRRPAAPGDAAGGDPGDCGC